MQSRTLERIDPTSVPAWGQLAKLVDKISKSNLKDLFESDSQRVEKYSVEMENLFLDYSKNLIDDNVLDSLFQLADQVHLPSGIKNFFNGNVINETEGRSVYHMALRAPSSERMLVDGHDVVPDVQAVLIQMEQFESRLDQEWKGYTGKRITDFVNIGIGGSDLGPVMVVEALRPYHVKGRRVHFVSNIDGSHMAQTLASLDPETTMFIIASKSFTTIETMTNARTARSWFLQKAKQEDVRKHFVAVSTNVNGVKDFGIDPQNAFEFWDWVGGRYSLSSAIGLSIMIAVGGKKFRELLAGMHAMDTHFRDTPPEQNIPTILALLGIWYTNFMGAQSEAVLPYDQNLQYLPSYLQQASMESNGKMVDRAGNPVHYDTGAILWGGAGTNSQHSFFQLLHQGTHLIPCDFILAVNASHTLDQHQTLLAANAFAQCEALMMGKSEDQVIDELKENGTDQERLEMLTPFKVFPGNRPSNMILLKELTPYNLGMLIAMYEHKIFVQGYIWNVFSYDQYGVELGKQLAKKIEPEINGEIMEEAHDPSTISLLRKYQSWVHKKFD